MGRAPSRPRSAAGRYFNSSNNSALTELDLSRLVGYGGNWFYVHGNERLAQCLVDVIVERIIAAGSSPGLMVYDNRSDCMCTDEEIPRAVCP
jgi:hypothetical protein